MCRTTLHTAEKESVKRCPRQDKNRPKKPQGGIPRNTGDDEAEALHGDDFMMYCLKVIPCKKTVPHEWSICPFAHQGEGAVRRDLRTHYYSGVVCPDMKKNSFCPRKSECPFAHCVFEYWLHPMRYRTVMCTEGDKCSRTFCFFAHCPEQLRQPKLGELRRPPRKRRQEATPQNAAHQPSCPANIITGDQARAAILNNLTRTMTAQAEALNTQLQTQGGSLPAHVQHMPAQGDSLSTYILDLPDFICRPFIKPQQVAIEAPGIGSYGGGVAALNLQGNPISMDGTPPLAQVQVAAYLAGMTQALGQRSAAARPSPPLLKPQVQLSQDLQVPSLPLPLLRALAQPQQQQPPLYGAPLAAQAWSPHPFPPRTLQQLRDQQQQQQQLGSSSADGTECYNSTFAAMNLADYPSLQGAPSSLTFAPAAHPECILPPDNPFNINTWGAPSPPQLSQVDATNPFTAESHRLPFDCIGVSSHMLRNGAVPDWSSGSTNSFVEAGCSLMEAPSAVMTSSHAAPLVSDAMFFNHRASLDSTPSLQSDFYPEFFPF